ncbi:MAG: replicative DNA helicase [Aquificota bacterium]|uniref:Replicative DNA helicase n=1 Tax=Thermosulfidibacter takaii TaxID=412593 RepID=A0A7C0Y7T1_9BACT|nr:MAG: replicative DNA helicase [Aquificota bacterium]RLD99478.1 MAG: replicative DNA helicase [Aquificota bacterium]HDD52965.1 replicative DNA helicase [Thermosulfidibacter takaii]
MKSEAAQEVRLPPQNIEAEQCVLGSVLLDNSALNKVLDILSPEDFYKREHQIIYTTMLDLYDKNHPIDLITLSDTLTHREELEAAGGLEYLMELAEVVPSSAHAPHYARIVKEKAVLRHLIRAATDILTICYEGGQEVEEVLDEAERRIFSVSEKKTRRDFIDAKALLKEAVKSLEDLAIKKRAITGIATGFRELDRLTSGFQPSDLIIIAARPSMGKTALALNIAQHAAIKEKKTVAIFSLEMSREQLALRMLSSLAKIPSHKLRTGILSNDEWKKLIRAANKLSDSPVYVDDTPALSVLEIRAKARRLMSEHRLDLVIIDYLQLMRSRSKTESRQQEISEISRSLKSLAKELNVPIVALSQLSRAVEGRQNKRPQLSDLRESGAIEQDGDLILFIYRPEVYKPDKPEYHGIAEIIVGKQRNGPTGTFKLTFLKEYTTFEEYAHEEDLDL